MRNILHVEADIKGQRRVPAYTVTQNDSVRLIVTVMDGGSTVNLDEVSTITLACTRRDGKVVVNAGEQSGPNEITFDLGTTEIEIIGKVDAVIQLYAADDRVSTIKFSFTVTKDPTGEGYVPSEEEQTLIEVVLGDGPLVIQRAETAATSAESASAYIDEKKPLIDKFTDEQTSLQAQLDEVARGATNVETSQARVDADGNSHTTLKARLDAEQAAVTSQLAENTKKLNLLHLNLNDFADFSLLADDYDITSIAEQAMAKIPSIVKGASGWRNLQISVFIPGGRWRITKKRVFDLSKYGVSAVRGFNVYGAGFENTQITFDNNVADSDNYLIYNNDNFGFSEISNIRFVSANKVEKCIYHNSGAGGNAQSIVYRNVTFVNFQTGISYNGISMTSEMDYYSCKFISTPLGGYGVLINNNQSVNHNFYGCDFESIFGHGIHVDSGGCVNIYGGSLIANDGGVILVTTDATGAKTGTGNNTFNFYAPRFEMAGTGMAFDVQSNVVLNFDGCNMTVEKSGEGNIRGIFGYNLTFVTWKNCTNMYKYEIRYNNSVYTNGACVAHFENCMLVTDLQNVIKVSGSGTNVAGFPLITSENCRINTTGTTPRIVVNNTLNKEVSNLVRSINTHTVIFRTGTDTNSGLPANTGATFTLPLNAIIKKIRIVHLASNLSGTFSYDVKDYTGNKTFVSLTSVAYNAESIATSEDLWYRIDTTDKQTISLVQFGTNNVQKGYIVVEYI